MSILTRGTLTRGKSGGCLVDAKVIWSHLHVASSGPTPSLGKFSEQEDRNRTVALGPNAHDTSRADGAPYTR